MSSRIRTVDLFCGCGGLALGFHLHRGKLTYETVLGADIDPAALRAFNHNFPAPGALPTGRRCDLSWFSHRAEVLLYYLSHYAAWAPDEKLGTSLEELGFTEFLRSLKRVDEDFTAAATRLARSDKYQNAWSALDSSVTSLARFKSAIGRLGLASLRTLILDAELPWSEDISRLDVGAAARAPEQNEALTKPSGALWDAEVEGFRESASKTGRGQHRTVSSRIAPVAELLESGVGRELRSIWIEWKAKRDSVRATFCFRVERQLDRLYEAGRQVQLLLGGPPCKGWSRIGRAVIESLRDQGAHAWASTEYGDQRNALLHKYVLFLDALRPTAFLFENVAHFESSLRTPSGEIHAASLLEEAINALSSQNLDFHVESQILRAKEHGVPQDRERFIMVGVRGGEKAPVLEQFFHVIPRYQDEVPLTCALSGLDDPGIFDQVDAASCGTDHRVKSYTLVDEAMPTAHRDYLTWVRQPPPGKRTTPRTVDGHIVRRARTDDQGLYEFMPPGTRWMDLKLGDMPTLKQLRETISKVLHFQKRVRTDDLPDAQLLEGLVAKLDDSLFLRLLLESIDPPGDGRDGHHLLHEGYLVKGTDRYGDWLERLPPDRPCKTIVAHIGKDTYGYIHPWKPRALSLREAARVQTFPDFFDLGTAGVADSYSMVGNAVPPLLASHFAAAFEALHVGHAFFGGEPAKTRGDGGTGGRQLEFVPLR